MDILQLSDLSPFYNLRDSTVAKSVVFEVSRYYTETKSSSENKGTSWRPWDKITTNVDQGNIYLGKIPSLGNPYYSTANQHEEIINFINKSEEEKHPLGLVVSAVDYFELSGYSVVSPANWAEKKVKQILIPVSDFSTNISNESIVAVVKEMRECVESGKSVYVHCKAGRSRSAMINAVYLGVYGDGQSLQPSDNIDEIEKYIVSMRPQVSLNQGQRGKAVDVIKIIKSEQVKQVDKEIIKDPLSQDQDLDEICADKVVELPVTSSKNLKDSLKEYLSSLELKNAIIHFTSFKMMAIYACSNQNWKHTSDVTNDIKAFFKSIYEATDDIWYLYLINTAGPLQKLIDESVKLSTPYGLSIWKADNTLEYKKECEKLRSDFIDELDNHLACVFHCSAEDIKSAALELSTAVKNMVAVDTTDQLVTHIAI